MLFVTSNCPSREFLATYFTSTSPLFMATNRSTGDLSVAAWSETASLFSSALPAARDAVSNRTTVNTYTKVQVNLTCSGEVIAHLSCESADKFGPCIGPQKLES